MCRQGWSGVMRNEEDREKEEEEMNILQTQSNPPYLSSQQSSANRE